MANPTLSPSTGGTEAAPHFAVTDQTGGSVTVQDVAEKGAASGYAQLDSGILVPTSILGSGAAGSTTFLRGDRTWAVPAGTGVSSLAKSGSAGLTGAVTLSQGANITLTQAGQDIAIAAAGGGAATTLTPLFDAVVGAGGAASIDTGAGGVAATGIGLRIILSLRSDAAGVKAQGTILRFNNDSGGNYDMVYVRGTNVTASATNLVSQTSVQFCFCAGAACDANTFAGSDLEVVDFQAAKFRTVTANTSVIATSAAADTFFQTFGARYKSTTVISRVSVAPSSGNFVQGSRMTILPL